MSTPAVKIIRYLHLHDYFNICIMDYILLKVSSKSLKLEDLTVYYHCIRPELLHSEICHIICKNHEHRKSDRQIKCLYQMLQKDKQRRKPNRLYNFR